jgi:hypothetical protein
MKIRDLPMVCWALGQELAYREGEGPVLRPIRSDADVGSLDLGRLTQAIAP